MHRSFTEARVPWSSQSISAQFCCGELRICLVVACFVFFFSLSLSWILPPVFFSFYWEEFLYVSSLLVLTKVDGLCDSLWLFWSKPEHALLILSQCAELSCIASGHVRLSHDRGWSCSHGQVGWWRSSKWLLVRTFLRKEIHSASIGHHGEQVVDQWSSSSSLRHRWNLPCCEILVRFKLQ